MNLIEKIAVKVGYITEQELAEIDKEIKAEEIAEAKIIEENLKKGYHHRTTEPDLGIPILLVDTYHAIPGMVFNEGGLVLLKETINMEHAGHRVLSITRHGFHDGKGRNFQTTNVRCSYLKPDTIHDGENI